MPDGVSAYDGLSPRVRGNPSAVCDGAVFVGSIPASAGEPAASATPSLPRTVYPRECGGTAEGALDDALDMGLSPRVRGNLAFWRDKPTPTGSIPASAGEPHHHWQQSNGNAVYPRECGGTGKGTWR